MPVSEHEILGRNAFQVPLHWGVVVPLEPPIDKGDGLPPLPVPGKEQPPAPPAREQPPENRHKSEPMTANNPLFSRDLARAKWEVSQADPRQLARTRQEIAREIARIEEERLAAGKVGADAITPWAREADAPALRGAEQEAYLEKQVRVTAQFEEADRHRYETGIRPRLSYLETRNASLEAQFRLAEFRGLTGK
jgi:hypothetical protein